MINIFLQIKDKIKTHPDVSQTYLGMVDEWKNSHYQSLEKIINKKLAQSEILKTEKVYELGKTISAITLKRFFENQFSENAKTDLRFIKTLDKLCIFLDYENLNDFVANQRDDKEKIEVTDTESNEYLFNIIKNCGFQEFECIKKLPEVNLLNVRDFVFENSPYYHRIMQYLTDLSKRNFKLLFENNNSNYEFFDIDLMSEEENRKVISSREFWNLTFTDHFGENYHYHIMNKQTYFLRKIDGAWKIWDNYSPNRQQLVKI